MRLINILKKHTQFTMFHIKSHLSGFDSRELQDIVYQIKQQICIFVDGIFEHLFVISREILIGNQIGKSNNCIEWCSYLMTHGYLGAELMRSEGFPRHARVCERHTGTGISLAMIEESNLPLPHQDFMPVTLEEQLICFADKFYSKTNLEKEKSIDKVKKSLSKYGENTVIRFDNWCKLFLGE